MPYCRTSVSSWTRKKSLTPRPSYTTASTGSRPGSSLKSLFRSSDRKKDCRSGHKPIPRFCQPSTCCLRPRTWPTTPSASWRSGLPRNKPTNNGVMEKAHPKGGLFSVHKTFDSIRVPPGLCQKGHRSKHRNPTLRKDKKDGRPTLPPFVFSSEHRLVCLGSGTSSSAHSETSYKRAIRISFSQGTKKTQK